MVISTIATVGNYEYGYYWYLHLDGTIEFEIKATEAWRYFLPWFRSRPLPFLLYGLFVVVLALGFFLFFYRHRWR